MKCADQICYTENVFFHLEITRYGVKNPLSSLPANLWVSSHWFGELNKHMPFFEHLSSFCFRGTIVPRRFSRNQVSH